MLVVVVVGLIVETWPMQNNRVLIDVDIIVWRVMTVGADMQGAAK